MLTKFTSTYIMRPNKQDLYHRYPSELLHSRCHQMETFSALLALSSPGEFPSQRPVTRTFDVFFDLRLNKGFGKQLSRRWWFNTPSRSLCRDCNVSLHRAILWVFQCERTSLEQMIWTERSHLLRTRIALTPVNPLPRVRSGYYCPRKKHSKPCP